MNFQALKAECVATSVYAAGDIVGNNISMNLPDVAFALITTNAAGGPVEIPVVQQIQSMEASISKSGLDSGFLASIGPRAFDLMANVIQTSTDEDGSAKEEHIKVYLRVVPKGIPALDLAPGEQTEKQITFTVYSYKIDVEGRTFLHIDKLKPICEINGFDYMAKTRSLL